MKKKKLLLIPAHIADQIERVHPDDRMLCVVGQFEPRQRSFWYPVRSGLLTAEGVDEAGMVFRRLRRTVLHDLRAMRRFCAGNPDARVDGYWCPTSDFACTGAVFQYRLRCMVNHGDFNYMLTAYQKTKKNRMEAA